MTVPWLLAIAAVGKGDKDGEMKAERAYLTGASAAQVLKTLTSSLECQVGTFPSTPLGREGEEVIVKSFIYKGRAPVYNQRRGVHQV